jgi:hypothetical protein
MVKVETVSELLELIQGGSGRDYYTIVYFEGGSKVFEGWLDNLPLEFYHQTLTHFEIRNGVIPEDPEMPMEQNTSPTYLSIRIK